MVNGKTSVEPKLKTALYERNHQLDDLFSVKTLCMNKKPRKDKTVKKTEVDETGTRDLGGAVERTGVDKIPFSPSVYFEPLFSGLL